LRHGRVWNPEGVVYARLPGFHLSEEGRAEVEELARALASAPIRAVYASPLDRTIETAAILASPHGLQVQPDDRLLEWSFWVRWQGMPWNRIRERDPEILSAYAEHPGLASPDDPLEQVGRRVLEWALDAEDRHAEGMVVGVAHEAPLTAAMLLGAGRSMDEYHSVTVHHLAAVRLRPGPPEPVDPIEWSRSC
jgi:broad specificity phosphatase PhoE